MHTSAHQTRGGIALQREGKGWANYAFIGIVHRVITVTELPLYVKPVSFIVHDPQEYSSNVHTTESLIHRNRLALQERQNAP